MPELRNDVLVPFYTALNGAVELYWGNVIDVLRKMKPKSVNCVVTSPPYWGLRDYGTGTWDGGDLNCDHSNGFTRNATAAEGNKGYTLNGPGVPVLNFFRDICGKCGAIRIDKQIGSEKTSEEFVATMVSVFRAVRRVLRDDGTLWLNLGDDYGEGELSGIPWRVALALKADGWILRQDIIWSKPSPMPESVKNRCTKSHEYIFLFAKQDGYYYDHQSIKTKAEPAIRITSGNKAGSYGQAIAAGVKPSGNGKPGSVMITGDTANKRSVWTVTSESFGGAHFATFPQKLIEPCILAGCPERVCTVCGSPQRRIVETKGWSQGCSCNADLMPGVVLDPFMGSGTTAVVALTHGRRAIGIDLNDKYIQNIAIPRIEGACYKIPDLAKQITMTTPRKAIRSGKSLLSR